MFNIVLALILVIIDVISRKYMGLSALLSVTIPALVVTISSLKMKRNFIPVWALSWVFISPVVTAKTILLTTFQTRALQKYYFALMFVYLFVSFTLAWINGWGYEKNFNLVSWKIMLGIEGDPNYSSAAILVVTIVLYLSQNIRLRALMFINTFAFLLFFSRTAFFIAIIFTLQQTICRNIPDRVIVKLNFILLFLVSAVPLIIVNIDYDFGVILDIYTSGRFGYWHYISTGEAIFGSENYYNGKQAHNALFQIINAIGFPLGSFAYFVTFFLFYRFLDKRFWTQSFVAVTLIQMFLNSFSSAYFLIWVIGGLQHGKFAHLGK
jgi:hypothetical protein